MSDPLSGLEVISGVDRLVNVAQLTVYPLETAGALQAIWTARGVLRVAPGETREISCPFRDENGERVGAVEVQSLVAYTDYTANERADGSGPDYTNDPAFSISMTVEATRALVTLENTATGTLYVTSLQIRGKPLRDYDPVAVEVTNAESVSDYFRRVSALDLAMISDPVFAQAYGEYVVGRFADPTLTANVVRVRNMDVVNGVNVFSLGLFDKVTVNDAQTGIDALDHWVRAVEYELTPTRKDVRLYLERADERKYCLLDRTGYAELDTNARLGF